MCAIVDVVVVVVGVIVAVSGSFECLSVCFWISLCVVIC